jgi:hypothetical protein
MRFTQDVIAAASSASSSSSPLFRNILNNLDGYEELDEAMAMYAEACLFQIVSFYDMGFPPSSSQSMINMLLAKVVMTYKK